MATQVRRDFGDFAIAAKHVGSLLDKRTRLLPLAMLLRDENKGLTRRQIEATHIDYDKFLTRLRLDTSAIRISYNDGEKDIPIHDAETFEEALFTLYHLANPDDRNLALTIAGANDLEADTTSGLSQQVSDNIPSKTPQKHPLDPSDVAEEGSSQKKSKKDDTAGKELLGPAEPPKSSPPKDETALTSSGDGPSQDPTATQVVQHGVSATPQIDARAQFELDFPYDYRVVFTGGHGERLCGIVALAGSVNAQHPTLPHLQVADLLAIVDSDEYKARMGASGDPSLLNKNYFTIDQLSAIIHLWGSSHGLNLRLGLISAGGDVYLATHPNEDPTIVVWIHSDDAEKTYIEGLGVLGIINHFSGAAPNSAPEQEPGNQGGPVSLLGESNKPEQEPGNQGGPGSLLGESNKPETQIPTPKKGVKKNDAPPSIPATQQGGPSDVANVVVPTPNEGSEGNNAAALSVPEVGQGSPSHGEEFEWTASPLGGDDALAVEEMLEEVERREQEMNAQMQALTNTKATEQLDPERWAEYCHFIGHNPARDHPTNDLIKFPGMKRTLKPHQVYLIFYQLVVSASGQNGGFCGDVMGFGKTTSAIGLFVARYIINTMWHYVTESRKKGRKEHLAEGTLHQPQEVGAKCPSGRFQGGWECPCVDSGFLRRHNITAKGGVTCAIVPRNLIALWRAEWEKCIGTDKEDNQYRLRLVIAHAGSARSGAYSLDQSTIEDMRSTKGAVDENSSSWGPAATNPVQPRHGNDRHFVVTTSHSLLNQLVERFHERREAGTKRRPLYKDVSYRIAFSLFLRDEFHYERLETSKTIQVLSTWWSKTGNPWIWAYSGTPIERSPLDIAAYVRLLEKDSWREQPRLRDCGSARLFADAKIWEGIKKSPEDNAELIRLVTARTQKQVNVLMIRRTEETRISGRPIIVLPPNHHRDVELLQHAGWEKPVQEFEARVKAQALETYRLAERAWVEGGRRGDPPRLRNAYNGSARYRLHNCINVPYFCTLLRMCQETAEEEQAQRFERARQRHQRRLQDPNSVAGAREPRIDDERFKLENMPGWLSLTQSEMDQNGWLSNPETSPYFRHIRDIARSSAKLAFIRQEVLRLWDTRDVHGAPVKQVYVSQYSASAMVIKLYLTEVLHIPNDQVVFVTSKTHRADRERYLGSFQRELGPDGEPMHKGNPRYLVATLASICTGISLIEAPYICLFEPTYNQAAREQLWKRVNRVGQRNANTETVQISIKDDPIEDSIRQNNKITKDLVEKTLTQTKGDADAQGLPGEANKPGDWPVQEEGDEV